MALAVMSASGALLAARGWLGPIGFPVRVNSPLNLEGIFALAFLALAAASQRRAGLRKDGGPAWLFAAAPLLAGFAFAGSLTFPFLADDYSHIWNARHADWAALWAHFTVPEEDRFFRPLVYWSYSLDGRWAGVSPLAWRAGNLAIHAVNTLLVYWLCREFKTQRAGAFFGACLFGLHGSNPEAVTWVAARFDLMAVMFGAGCVLAVIRGARWWASAALLAPALMSKESAYAVPALAAAALWYLGMGWREIARRIAPLVAVAGVAFGYRLWLLGGIGGYRDAVDGSDVVFQMRFASELKALLPRFWGAMIFPLNWTGGLDRTTAGLLIAAMVGMGYLAWRGADRRKLLLGFGLATICSLPVHQFLSIGPDLEKSRVLYFASIGLAVIFAALCEGLDRKAFFCAVTIVGFQWAALENNLGHWRQVGQLAAKTCVAGAEAAGRGLAVTGLPNVVDGVYFLHTGFPECVKFLRPEAEAVTARRNGLPALAWDGAARELRAAGN